MVVIGCQWLFVTYGLRDPYLTDVPARPDRICECMYVVPSGLGMDRASPLFFAVSAAGCEGEKVSGSIAVCWASGREPAERERAQDPRVIRMTSRLIAVRCRERRAAEARGSSTAATSENRRWQLSPYGASQPQGPAGYCMQRGHDEVAGESGDWRSTG